MLVELFRWSINDIDEMDIESLLPFFSHYLKIKGKSENKALVPGDQTDFA